MLERALVGGMFDPHVTNAFYDRPVRGAGEVNPKTRDPVFASTNELLWYNTRGGGLCVSLSSDSSHFLRCL